MKYIIAVLILIALVFIIGLSGKDSPQESFGSVPRNESYYTNLIANTYNLEVSVITPKRTICDLTSEDEAIEVEWSTKPYEAVGQALHYSVELGKRPVMLFLLDKDKPSKEFVESRVKDVAKKYNIGLWWYDIPKKKLVKE